MRKNYYIIILVLSIILGGCNKINNNITQNTVVDNSQEKTSVQKNQNVDSQKETNTEKSQSIIYTNDKLGFSLELPETWKESYIINEYEEGFIEVSFIGQSKVSKGYIGDTKYSDGLLMFYIVTSKVLEEFPLDQGKKIGNINGMDFYYATATDYAIGALDLSEDQAMSDLITDKAERGLMQVDYIKAKEMEKDIDEILKTFKAN